MEKAINAAHYGSQIVGSIVIDRGRVRLLLIHYELQTPVVWGSLLHG